jgi:hypothetical protein
VRDTTKPTPGPWKYVADKGCIISTSVPKEESLTAHGVGGDETWDYYGGEVVCETICGKDGFLVEAAPFMLDALKDAKLQIEYLHEKFKETGTGNRILSRIENVIRLAEEGQ